MDSAIAPPTSPVVDQSSQRSSPNISKRCPRYSLQRYVYGLLDNSIVQTVKSGVVLSMPDHVGKVAMIVELLIAGTLDL